MEVRSLRSSGHLVGKILREKSAIQKVDYQNRAMTPM
jgi:hypothetical protein